MIFGVDGNEANVARRVGSNQYSFELLHALYKLPEAKKHDWIIYLREKPLPDMPQISTWWRYKVFGPKYFWTQFVLPLSLTAGRKINVFFTPGHYRPRWSPVPTVIPIMDLGYLRFPDQFTKKDLLQLTIWTARSIKKASHILAISESTKKDIIKFYKIPSNKITVTYPGYDRKKFQITRPHRIRESVSGEANSKSQTSKIKTKYKIQNDYILFLGTLKPSKNIESLLEAFKLIINHYLSIILVVAGKKGWLYGSIFEKGKQLGLEKQVVFTDYVDEEDKPALLAGAKVLVNPSFWEGFGMHIVEAMAVGTPVVVSNVGSLPEVVGDAGILVNPYKPKSIAIGIQKALASREIYVKRGLEQSKNFDWIKTARTTLGVLERVVKQV